MQGTHRIDESYFLELTAPFLKVNTETEALSLSLTGEETSFIRFNRARVRQAGIVQDTTLSATYQERARERAQESAPEEIREASASLTLTGDLGTDRLAIRGILDRLKSLARGGAPKPLATWPERGESSSFCSSIPGLPTATEWSALVLPTVADLDFTGILSSGRMFRANRNSLGLSHWFETESATLDYSLISPSGRAVKSEFLTSQTFNRDSWTQTFAARIQRERQILAVLERPARKIQPGDVRCYLGPAAVQDLIGMFSWGCIGEDAIRQGTSPLSQLRQAVKEGVAKTRFSDQFHLFEDFKLNPLPRFNERGEVAPERMELIVAGELKNTWISARSAKEYGIQSNSASSSETLRAPVLAGGTLAEQDALQTLGSGVYLPNLHYLNWSDQSAGRITGMTRHACVWVENGVPVAPIENMRWDDTLFRVFGSELEALTREQTSIPDTSSYEFRSIGGLVVPGALLRSFRFVS